MLSTCGVFLIDSSKIVTNVCPFLVTTVQLFLHLKVDERGPRNIAIGDYGSILGGPCEAKHEDMALICGIIFVTHTFQVPWSQMYPLFATLQLFFMPRFTEVWLTTS